MADKKTFNTSISTSLDTILGTTLGANYNIGPISNRQQFHYKKKNNNTNSNLISDKSNNNSKSSSGSSLTITNQNINPNYNTNNPNQFPHHTFYASQQISTSANNWNNNSNRTPSIGSQKVSLCNIFFIIEHTLLSNIQQIISSKKSSAHFKWLIHI